MKIDGLHKTYFRLIRTYLKLLVHFAFEISPIDTMHF